MNAAAVRTTPVGIAILRQDKPDQAQIDEILINPNAPPELTQHFASPKKMIDRFATKVQCNLAEHLGDVGLASIESLLCDLIEFWRPLTWRVAVIIRIHPHPSRCLHQFFSAEAASR